MSIIPALDATDIANLQAMERDVMVQTARPIAIAGPTLTVKRIPADANELTERPTPVAIGTVEGHIYIHTQQRIITPSAPDFTPVTELRFVSGTAVITPAVNPPQIVEGDTLIDPDALTEGYQVMGIEPFGGPFVAIVNKVTVEA